MKIIVLYITPDEEARQLILEADNSTNYLEEDVIEAIKEKIPDRTCNLPFFLIGHYKEEEPPPVVFHSDGNEVPSEYEVL